MAAITSLIDDLTDIHLEYIEPFRSVIDDGGSDGYSQSSRQEFLCYQYALLVHSTYQHVTRNLGSDFDMTKSSQVPKPVPLSHVTTSMIIRR